MKLPSEIRDMVYDELWKVKKSVAAYHKATASGILAYYDGMVLNEFEMMNGTEITHHVRT
jgi:hypothetical protein